MASTPASSTSYTRTAVALHWAMAAGLLAAWLVGWWASDLPMSPQRLKALTNHKWAGITLLALLAVRLMWRWRHPPPAPLPMPPALLRVLKLGHAGLYVLMGVVPLLGWAYSNAAGFPVVWFGVLPLPNLLPKDPAWADALKWAHKLGAWTLALLVLGHGAAALKHHFIDRDATLSRMRWPRP